MGQLSAYTNTFTAGTKAKASEVNTNFSEIQTVHNATDAELPAYTNGSRVICSNSGQTAMEEATATTTEVNYLSGVTSAIQTQISAKAASSAVVLLDGSQNPTGLLEYDSDLSGSMSTGSNEIPSIKWVEDNTQPTVIGLACSDETTDLTAGTAKVTFRMPHAVTLTEVRAEVNTAPVGSTIIVDINEAGVSILSTKLTIDVNEETSETAAVPAVISDSSLADNAKMTIDIDQIGSSTAGKGLKVWLIGKKA